MADLHRVQKPRPMDPRVTTVGNRDNISTALWLIVLYWAIFCYQPISFADFTSLYKIVCPSSQESVMCICCYWTTIHLMTFSGWYSLHELFYWHQGYRDSVFLRGTTPHQVPDFSSTSEIHCTNWNKKTSRHTFCPSTSCLCEQCKDCPGLSVGTHSHLTQGKHHMTITWTTLHACT